MKNRHRKVLELLASSGESLHGLLGRLTLDEQVTGDLLQELFIRLGNSNGFTEARDTTAYARRAAINLAFEWRRSQKQSLQPLNEDCLPVPEARSTLDNMIRIEDLQQILDATSQLSELARQVVVMRFIEQQSYDQIARQLGKKPQHLRAECSKALSRLRILLAEDKSR
ncbi:RNA polymerase sigma factor [Planctomycetota bacterium]